MNLGVGLFGRPAKPRHSNYYGLSRQCGCVVVLVSSLNVVRFPGSKVVTSLALCILVAILGSKLASIPDSTQIEVSKHPKGKVGWVGLH